MSLLLLLRSPAGGPVALDGSTSITLTTTGNTAVARALTGSADLTTATTPAVAVARALTATASLTTTTTAEIGRAHV